MDLVSRLQTCYAHLRQGDVMGAETLWHQIMDQYGQNGDVLHLGALIAGQAGEDRMALARIEGALKANPRHHEYLNTKGNIYRRLQDIPAAVTAWRASLKARPDYLVAWQNLGSCLIDNQDPQAALDVYMAGLEYFPDDELLQIGQVVALKDCMREAEALAALKAMKHPENHAYVHGQILFQMHKFDAAMERSEMALQDDKYTGPALQNLCQTLWVQGRWDEARDRLETYLEKAGHTRAAYVTVIRLLAKADHLDEADALVRQATTRLGGNPHIDGAAARICIHRGEMGKARDLAGKALMAVPGDLALMADYADAALATGQAEQALQAAAYALGKLPNNQYWLAVRMTALQALGRAEEFPADVEKYVVPFELEPPDGFASLSEYNAALKSALDNLHDLKEHPLDQSLRNGTQTIPDLRFVDHPLLKAHFKALDTPIRAYMKRIGHDPAHPLRKRNTGDYLITGAWSVKLRQAGFHVSHVHPQGWISSAYYVEVPEEVDDEAGKPGWIHFGKPPFAVPDMNGRALDYQKIIKPKAGTLVLFPSYMWHGTNPLQGNATRMTLPIDVVPR